MALLLRFSFVAQVIAAFVIFVLGYIGLFCLLMIAFIAARAVYESVKWIRASAARRVLANASASSEGEGGAARNPFLFAPAGKMAQPVEVSFHPVRTRRRAAGNYSWNHPGGMPR